MDRLPWRPGRWRIARSAVYIGGLRGWSVTFPHTNRGMPVVRWRSSHAAAVALMDQAARERWPGT